MVSGTLSPSSSECFSPFPHGTRSLSVSRECSALPGGPGGFAQDYSCPALLRIPLHQAARLRVRACHPLRGRFPAASPRRAPVDGAVLQPRRGVATAPVWANPRSLAATGGITFVFFSCRYLDVSVPCVCLPYGIICLQHIGLSHSEISASKVICT